MRMSLGIVVCASALALSAAAQNPALSKEPAKASLEGSVVKEPGGEPVKKAIVELIGENQEEGGNHTATSDQEGHFKITGVEAGRYRLFVERPGFLQVDKKRRRSEGMLLSFDSGQEVKEQILRMLPAAVITGRVVDEDGDPMPNVEVTVLRRKASPGRPKFDPSGSAQTNDLGEYRIGGLLAGKYFVSANPLPNFQSLVPAQKNPDDPTPATADLAYVTTFYPATTDRAQAAPVDLHAGDDMPIDFSLARAHTVRIRGSVTGLAPGAKAVVMLGGANSMSNAGEVDKNGKFELLHVAPGTYTLMAMTLVSDGPQQTIRRTIDVGESNIDDLRLVPQAGAIVHGRVHFGDKVKLDASPIMVIPRRIDEGDDFLDNVGFTSDDMTRNGVLAKLKPDGTFELKDVPAGLYTFEVLSDSKALTDTFLESVVAGTKDVTDTGLKIGGGTLSVDLTVSAGAGVMDGAVTNEKGEPTPNAVVVAIPEAKYRKQTARYQRVSADQSGHFTLRGVQPGVYTLIAWEVLEDEEYLDPEFLKPYEGQGTTIKLEKDGHKTVPLKMIPAADQP